LNDHYSMGVAYAQRVVNSERGTFEKQHGWVIKTIEREPSLVRDEYAPMIFAQETISYLESLDMMFRDVNFKPFQHCFLLLLSVYNFLIVISHLQDARGPREYFHG